VVDGSLSIKPDDQTVRDLFLQAFYEVPDFQREYVWGAKKEVQRLLEDLIQAFRENEPDYFLGSIVYFAKDGTRVLVDGQQRLTTLALLLAALQVLIQDPPPVLSKAIRDIDPKGFGDDVRFRVELQYTEITKVLEDLCSGKRSQLAPGRGGPRYFLVHAFDKCLEHLATELGDEDQEELTAFFQYVWNSTHVVTIETLDLRSAYKIFETLNDRGRALNASDLLRNYLFKSAASDRQTQDAIRESWKELTTTLRNAGEGTQVRFLRYYLVATFGLTSDEAKEQRLTGRDSVIRASDVFDWITSNDHELHAKKGPKALAQQLAAASQAYANFLEGRNAKGKPVEALANIGYQRTGVRQHLCLLLAGRELPAASFARLCEGLESLTLAFALADVPWNTLEKRLPGWSSNIRACKSETDVDAFMQAAVVPEIVRHRIKITSRLDSIHADSPSLAKYVLSRVTHFAQASAFAGGSMAQLMDSKVSVEHILPRSLKNPVKAKEASWKDFGVASRDEALPYVERLGNLCLVDWGVNSQLSDHTYANPPEGAPANYVVKRERLAFVPWLLTRAIASSTSPVKLGTKATAGQDKFIEKYGLAPRARRWNAAEIQRRQRYLLTMIRDVWPILLGELDAPGLATPLTHGPDSSLTELIALGEGETREFKASLRYDVDLRRDNKGLVVGPVHTTSAFMNTAGGTLLVGITNKGEIVGIGADLDLSSNGQDGLELFYRQALVNAIGAKFTTGVSVSFPQLDGQTLCRIEVEASPRPVFVERKVDGAAQKQFYVRSGNGTRPLDAQAAHEYIEMHW
jgi:hypothetical protein